MTFRVEVTRDETRSAGGVSIAVTAYIDRVPQTSPVDLGRLTRAPKGVWNSRLLFMGDFDALADALAAIEAAFPEVAEISCNEFRSTTNSPTKWRRSANPMAGGCPERGRDTGRRRSSIGGSGRVSRRRRV